MDQAMFDGTAARQLVLVDDAEAPMVMRRERPQARPRLQPLVKDLYRQLDLRRRRAQIAARKYVDQAPQQALGGLRMVTAPDASEANE